MKIKCKLLIALFILVMALVFVPNSVKAEETFVTIGTSGDYSSVEAALNAGATKIKLIDDEVRGEFTISAGKNITIDLNGCSLYNTDSNDHDSITVTNNGALTIIDSSSGTDGLGEGEVWSIENYGNLILNSGAIDALNNNENSSFTMNGGYLYNLLNEDGVTYAINNGLFNFIDDKVLKEYDTLVYLGYHMVVSVTDPKTGITSITFPSLGSYFYLNDSIDLISERMTVIDSSIDKDRRADFQIVKAQDNQKINIDNFSNKVLILNPTDITVILNNRIIGPNFDGKLADASYNISSLNAEIASPVAGNLPSKTATFTNNLNLDVISEYEVIWRKFIGGASDSREMPKNWTDMQENEKFVSGGEYMVLIDVTLKNGYGFGPGFSKTVNSNNSMMATADNGFAYQFSKLPIDYSYTFKTGDNQKFTMKKITEYTFTVDGDFNQFIEVVIEGLSLTKGTDYNAHEGSTIITFTAEGLKKLNTLTVGEHKVKVLYSNQKTVEGKLIIEEDKTPVTPTTNGNENNQENTTNNENQTTNNDHKTTNNENKITTNETNTNNSNIENPKTYDGGILGYIAMVVVALAGIIVTKTTYRKKAN